MARQKIDINVDMGESFGMYKLGSDEEIMQFCTSANVACGFHASDPHVMRHTVEMAKQSFRHQGEELYLLNPDGAPWPAPFFFH